MRTFDLLTPAAAMAKLTEVLAQSHRTALTESVPAYAARNRVLARDVVSPIPLPEFRRSTVDGYAVRAASTPGTLQVTGEARMGELATQDVGPGEAVLIHTGASVPAQADTVVMVEQTQAVPGEPSTTAIRVTNAVRSGDNIIQQGEDVQAGETVLPAGMRLREQDIGGLLSIGMNQVEVMRQPRVALIASGDEVVPPEQHTKPGQVRNINTPMLAALVQRHGGLPLDFGILPDRREDFEQAAQRAMREADVVVFMAGSSVGERDFTPEVVNGMGQPGILAHGIAFRPGKPTLFAVCDGKPVFGLPGNPISALVTATLFVLPVLWQVQGARNAPTPNVVGAVLSQDVKSPRDLEHWFPVSVSGLEPSDGRGGETLLTAAPIASKSNLIFSLSRASGLVCAPIGVDRLTAGSVVDVRLFD